MAKLARLNNPINASGIKYNTYIWTFYNMVTLFQFIVNILSQRQR